MLSPSIIEYYCYFFYQALYHSYFHCYPGLGRTGRHTFSLQSSPPFSSFIRQSFFHNGFLISKTRKIFFFTSAFILSTSFFLHSFSILPSFLLLHSSFISSLSSFIPSSPFFLHSFFTFLPSFLLLFFRSSVRYMDATAFHHVNTAHTTT